MDREKAISVRNDETDVLKMLVIYAKNQGSKTPEKLYMVYTKLVYKTLDIKSGLRCTFSSSQLTILATLEIMIAQTVIELMKDNVHYKTIYKAVKQKLHSFVGLVKVKEIYTNDDLPYTIKIAS